MNKQAFLLLTAILVASGCAHGSGEDQNTSKNSIPDKGLVVEEFKVSDNEINANQQAIITLRLKNYHKSSMEINDISLYNTGVLEVGEKSCSPSKENIGTAKEGIVPEMECSWIVKAEDLQNFRSKNIPIKLNLNYSAEFTTPTTTKVHFRPLGGIEKTREISRSFSNNEVKLSMETENPIPYNNNGTFYVKADSVGKGRVAGNSYSFSYSPESLFKNCPEDEEFVIGSKIEFACPIKMESDSDSQTTRHVSLSTSYKYVKQPSLDIRVVNNQ